jgi:CubicO group peptidase (beta-lactamase class C family)
MRLPPIAFALGLLPAAGCSSAVQPPLPTTVIPVFPGPRAGHGQSTAGAATAKQLDADATIMTASGGSFTVAKGWWVTKDKDSVLLEDPDRGLHAWLIEVHETDAAKAIAAAWKRVQPGFSRKEEDVDSRPPIRGWDETRDVGYVTATPEHRAVFASLKRHGGTCYVWLVDGDEAVVGRRGAQLETAIWTLHVPGVIEESFAGRTPHPLDEARSKELAAFAEEARRKLEVPGTAVAVVQGGKVVFERGFGVKTLGRKDPVGPETLFMMGSITKSMTTMMEAALVDAGKFAWDTPVTTVFPDFALGDPETTRKLTMAHTACACTGFPRQDMEFLFESEGVTPEKAVARMRTWKPTTGFGETFQYSNMMVAAGGYAAARAFDSKAPIGEAYDRTMRETVFGPIGMKATTLDFAVAERGDHATPHGEAIDGMIHPLPIAEEHMVLPVRPAGGVWSNVRDMARYVMTEMSKGVSPEGKRVVSEANLLERRKPRVRSGELTSYGLGLEVGTFRDLPIVTHNGGTFGFTTLMFDFPEQSLGIIVLTNASADEAGAYLDAVHRKVVELVFEGRPLAAARVDYAVKKKKEHVAKELAKLTPHPDPAWFAGLTGEYTNEALGKVRIAAGPKGGTFDAGEWKTAFAQRKDPDGTMKIELSDPPMAGMTLVVAGDAAHPTLTLETDQQKYTFTRAGK